MANHGVFAAQESGEDTIVQVRRFKMADGLRCIKSAWRLFIKNPELWILMSLLCMILAVATAHVPLFGVFVLAFLAPILIAGTLTTAEDIVEKLKSKQKRTAKQSPQAQLVELLVSAPKRLFSVFTDEDKIFQIFQLSMLTVVLVLLEQFLVNMIAGSALLDTVQFAEMGVVQILTIVVAGIIAIAFYFLIGALFIYTIPLCTLGDASVLGGVFFSFKAVTKSLVPFTVFLVMLSIPLVLIFLSVWSFSLAGMLVALILGSLCLPIITNSTYCSYKLTYRWL